MPEPHRLNTSGYSDIEKLSDLNNWTKWDRSIRRFVSIVGMGDTMLHDEPPPKREHQTDTDYNGLYSMWPTYQTQLLNIVLNRTDGQVLSLLEIPVPPKQPVRTIRQALKRLADAVRHSQTGPSFQKLVQK